MKRHDTSLVRLHRFLVRMFVPSLGQEYAAEASNAFGDLYADARSGSFLRLGGLLAREARSLIATSFSEYREERSNRRLTRRLRKMSMKGSPGSSGESRLTSSLLDVLLQDLRYTLRNLLRSPGFVVIVLLSLTFGIAVSTVLFSGVNAAVFRPVPHVENQDALVMLTTGTRRVTRGPSSFPDYLDYREMSETLEDAAAFRPRSLVISTGPDATREMNGMEVSENFFDLLGVRIPNGRGFIEEDIAAGGSVVVIGYSVWENDFGGDPDILGRVLRIDGDPHTIVGVAPERLVGLRDPLLVEAVVPSTERRDLRGRLSYLVVGRMKEGVTVQQVQAEFEAVTEYLVEAYPSTWNYRGNNPRHVEVTSLRESRLPPGLSAPLVVAALGAVVTLILLISCSNVANLLLTRALRRRTEIAVRCAIGAPRSRLLKQLLTENLLLFGVAGGLGLLATDWLTSLATRGWTLMRFPGIDFTVDHRVAAFAIGLALFTGLSFGLVPALQASRPDLLPALKGLEVRIRFRRLGVRNLLVGSQIAGSLVLVMVTLFLVRGLQHARTIDLGFDPSNVAVVSLDLAHRDYEEAEGIQFLDNLAGRLEGVRGVSKVAVGSWIPLQGGSGIIGGLEPEGYQPGPQESVEADYTLATSGYFDVVGIQLLRGRDISESDDAAAPEVVVVNQAFVDRYWPGESGIGGRLRTFSSDTPMEVIGVVANAKYRSIAEEVRPQIWLPLAQHYESGVILHIRTHGDPRPLLPTIRQQVHDLDPDLPIIRADLMENITANGTLPQRILSMVLGGVGVIALALAMLGIYGVIAYAVSQRTREVGIRVALGARPGKVVGMVVREGLGLSALGLVIGLAVGAGVAQLLRALFFGLSPLDFIAVGGTLGLMVLAAVTASLLPALRAARVDPVKSLRWE